MLLAAAAFVVSISCIFPSDKCCSKCKHFEIEGVPPRLAIAAVTMCRELLRVKRGEKADFMFILGFPSVASISTSENKAAFALLVKEAGLMSFEQSPVSLSKLVLPLNDLLAMGFSWQSLFVKGYDPKLLFLKAIECKMDVKVFTHILNCNLKS
jgi:hypothetical protein